MLIYSMGVSVDGFIADREGAFGWSIPSEEQFRFHIAQTRELGGFLCGRRLYETMLVWETDPSLRDDEAGAAFADVWCAIPKVVFSRTLDSVQGNARLAEASLAEEAAAALDATDKDVGIGGAGLAALPCVIGDGDPGLVRVTPRVLGKRLLSLVYPREARLDQPVQAVIRFVIDVMRENAGKIAGAVIDEGLSSTIGPDRRGA